MEDCGQGVEGAKDADKVQDVVMEDVEQKKVDSTETEIS